ncbi:MAG: MFS transporter [Acidobacteriaceae bacterium]|nr:MFS transporter [Acidobacteriaceae bacterium]
MSSHIKHARWMIPFLGFACAVGVSSIYYNQPLLLEMAKSFHIVPGHTGFVSVATLVGYALGLFLLVPLGDVTERRALMMRMFAAVSIALFATAAAPNFPLLLVASAAVGLFASVTHVVLPIAPSLASDDQRGRAIGTVMTGLLLGILLARTFAGWISAASHWRIVFVVAGVINLAFVPLVWKVMPLLEPTAPIAYGQALRSLWTLFRTQPLLRESSFIGSLVFASFSTFWTTLVFLLGSPHYHLGPGVAGSFGILGATGALIAPFAGRYTDRRGSRYVVGYGLTTLATSYFILWIFGYHMAGLIVGVIILDLGAQATQIANQTRIFGIDSAARSRLNTVYMTIYFAGASLGSALASLAWVHYEWRGVCVLALFFISMAGLVHIFSPRTPVAQAHLERADAVLEA